MSFFADLNTIVQYVDRKENYALVWERTSGSWLCCSGYSGLIPPLLPLTRLLFTKPWRWVGFRVRVSATKFSSLPSLPRVSQWAGGSMGFPWPWHIWCLPGDGVGEIRLGLVGPKRLFKKKQTKKNPLNIVISYLNHNFISSQ